MLPKLIGNTPPKFYTTMVALALRVLWFGFVFYPNTTLPEALKIPI